MPALVIESQRFEEWMKIATDNVRGKLGWGLGEGEGRGGARGDDVAGRRA